MFTSVFKVNISTIRKSTPTLPDTAEKVVGQTGVGEVRGLRFTSLENL